MAKKLSLKTLYTSYFSQDRTVWGWGSCLSYTNICIFIVSALWKLLSMKKTSSIKFTTSQLDIDFKPEILLKQLVASVSVIIDDYSHLDFGD